MKTLIFFLGLISIVGAQAQTKNDVVAEVGNKKITVEEFNKKYEQVQSAYNPPSKQEFLEDLVRFEVGVQEAKKRNLEKDPLVQERLQTEMYKVLLEKELSDKVSKITVTEDEMKKWYANNPEIRLSQILIEVKPDATAAQRAEAKKRADEIASEVQKSKRPFEELVKLYSDDISKHAGGDIGWQSRLTIVPHVYEQALKMKVGEIKGPIDTKFGFQIIKLTGKRTYENAYRPQIRAGVFDEKRKAIFDDYFKKLKAQYTIKTNPSVLK
jgi:peptidyl-prolyl cis-trans isomerase C/peptidyl-prolyl cis-trans isomerase D